MNINEALGIIMSNLQDIPARGSAHNLAICTDGNEILCASEPIAIAIADMLDALFNCQVSHVGYYDPVEDERCDCVDEYTGWYYVDFD